MRSPPAFLALLALLALTACARPDPRCAVLPGGGRYCLQPTTAIAPFAAQQKVDAAIDGRRETMIVDIETDANGMRVAVLTPFGHKLVEMGYDNAVASASARPDPRLDPALAMAMLQLALWPAEAVRAGLDEGGEGVALEEGERQRRILSGGEVLMSVSWDGNAAPYRRLTIALPAARLTLEVETLFDMENQQ